MTLRHFRVRMFILSSRTICSTPFLEYLTTHLHFNVLTYISLLDHIQLCNETANGLLVHFKMYFLPTRMIRFREALLKNGKNAVQYVSVLKKLEKVASFQHITTMQHTTYSTYFKIHVRISSKVIGICFLRQQKIASYFICLHHYQILKCWFLPFLIRKQEL